MTKENSDNKKKFPASVIQIIDRYQLGINMGSKDGIKKGQEFLLFEFSKEEIKDPTSGEILGKLEIPKGTGNVIHVQDKMSIIESNRMEPSKRTIIKREQGWREPFFTPKEEETIIPSGELLPFQDPKVKDKVKPI